MPNMSRDEIAERVADAVRELYAAAGLSQTELAERVGMDQTTVSRLARGVRPPTTIELVELEHAAGRPRGWVLARAGLLEVDRFVDVESAIVGDPELGEAGRVALLAAYRGMLADAARRRD